MPDNLHSRPDKLSDAETVLYEIDMLRFSRERLSIQSNFKSDADEWVYLEAFLVHFRNLIEFFKGDASRMDTLTISRPNDIWPNGSPDAGALAFLSRPDLWDKYEGLMDDKISKYLQHCTTQRVIKKKWNVEQMYGDLLPVIEKFESLLSEFKPATKPMAIRPTAVVSTDQDAKSTASTRSFNSAPDLGSIEKQTFPSP